MVGPEANDPRSGTCRRGDSTRVHSNPLWHSGFERQIGRGVGKQQRGRECQGEGAERREGAHQGSDRLMWARKGSSFPGDKNPSESSAPSRDTGDTAGTVVAPASRIPASTASSGTLECGHDTPKRASLHGAPRTLRANNNHSAGLMRTLLAVGLLCAVGCSPQHRFAGGGTPANAGLSSPSVILMGLKKSIKIEHVHRRDPKA